MALPIPKLTPEQYLATERLAGYKSEYYNGEMFAMAGGTGNHSSLAFQFPAAMFARLTGRECFIYNSDVKVRVSPVGLYTYPDATVVCGKPIYADKESDVLTNPKLIVEVLSPSTEAKDRGFKFGQYKTIGTLQEYVLVSQSEPRVERYYRALGGEWGEYSDSSGTDSVVILKSLAIEIPLAEIYRDIEFTAGGTGL